MYTVSTELSKCSTNIQGHTCLANQSVLQHSQKRSAWECFISGKSCSQCQRWWPACTVRVEPSKVGFRCSWWWWLTTYQKSMKKFITHLMRFLRESRVDIRVVPKMTESTDKRDQLVVFMVTTGCCWLEPADTNGNLLDWNIPSASKDGAPGLSRQFSQV